MIQRIQTVYLLVAVVLTMACLCLKIGAFTLGGVVVLDEYNLWVTNALGGHAFHTWPLFALLVLSAAIGVYSIFIYGNRLVQARFCMFNALLLAGWYILYTVYSQVLAGQDGQMLAFRPGIPAAFPAVAIVLYMMARRSILADEKLVRAADRIR
jgi:hypothetical protein